MKYAVDKIIDNIAVLEELETKEKLEIEVINLPRRLREGNILVYKDNKYVKDYKEEYKRRKNLRDRLEKLKKIKKEGNDTTV